MGCQTGKLGTVVHTCNPIGEEEAEGSRIQDQPGFHYSLRSAWTAEDLLST